ncbi:SDR family NAD(P)-dependent oxidoreductase [Nocardioides sp. B-3]|uniref:SDR family NAD(P)-dependent oxidoreductase n=1 Tax=Nocardioides sp. B-3 TaxID=2895565 RepID=UPI003FA5A737
MPVDYVAKAMDHPAHAPGHDGEAFHLVNPEPQPVVETIGLFCAAAGAPRFATPIDRRVTASKLVPRPLRPSTMVGALVRSGPIQLLLDQTIGRAGIPAEVVGHTSFTAVFDSRRTEEALAGSGIAVPDTESYARTLWGYWEDNLDETTGRSSTNRAALEGKHVVITGASSGIGPVTALKVAQCGGIPVLVARGKDKLEETRALIEQRGGQAHVYPCDLSDLRGDRRPVRADERGAAVDRLRHQQRRPLDPPVAAALLRPLPRLRAHDAAQLLRCDPADHGADARDAEAEVRPHRQRQLHRRPDQSPAFSAYVASKAALDSWSNVVASEVVGNGVTFTNIHMPLVRTPMIAPTKLYDKFPTISPARAADILIRAMVDRPHEINTALGNVGAIAHTVAPKAAFRLLNMAYHVFPDSAAAKGQTPDGGTRESEQIMLAKVFKGIHW